MSLGTYSEVITTEYRLEALASRLIIGMASGLMIKLLVVVAVVVVVVV